MAYREERYNREYEHLVQDRCTSIDDSLEHWSMIRYKWVLHTQGKNGTHTILENHTCTEAHDFASKNNLIIASHYIFPP